MLSIFLPKYDRRDVDRKRGRGGERERERERDLCDSSLYLSLTKPIFFKITIFNLLKLICKSFT